MRENRCHDRLADQAARYFVANSPAVASDGEAIRDRLRAVWLDLRSLDGKT
jgi:hypothetical protein